MRVEVEVSLRGSLAARKVVRLVSEDSHLRAVLAVLEEQLRGSVTLASQAGREST